MRKKILLDIYLAYNLGDDMFLEHLAKRFPNVDFVPFHPGKNYHTFFANYANVKAFPYNFWDKLKARLGKSKLNDFQWMSQEYDGLLFLGGGIFREESYWKEVHAYRKNTMEAFKSKNKPVWYAGCNFGPYQSKQFLKAYKDIFAEVDKITFRDLHSYALFSDLKNVAYAPDLLWSFNLPIVKKEDKYLGISIIDPRHKQGLEHTFDAYVKSHIQLVKEYQSKGFKVSLFAFCEQEGDNKIAQLIMNEVGAEVQLFTYAGDINTYLMKMGKCSHFVAARFHANIIAMHYNQWLIPVIYGDKTNYLLKDLKIEGIALNDIETLPTTSFLQVPQEKIVHLASASSEHLNIDL